MTHRHPCESGQLESTSHHLPSSTRLVEFPLSYIMNETQCIKTSQIQFFLPLHYLHTGSSDTV